MRLCKIGEAWAVLTDDYYWEGAGLHWLNNSEV